LLKQHFHGAIQSRKKESEMKRLKLGLQMMTVASSVLLITGFVCYRAGAFSWAFRGSAGNGDMVDPIPSGISAETAGQQSPTMFSSSKSAIIVGSESVVSVESPIPEQEKSPAESQPQRVGPTPIQEQERAPAESQRKRVRPQLMPGSKSAPVFVEPPGQPDAQVPGNKPPSGF
jgi:hypothetical protein